VAEQVGQALQQAIVVIVFEDAVSSECHGDTLRQVRRYVRGSGWFLLCRRVQAITEAFHLLAGVFVGEFEFVTLLPVAVAGSDLAEQLSSECAKRDDQSFFKGDGGVAAVVHVLLLPQWMPPQCRQAYGVRSSPVLAFMRRAAT